VSCDVLGNIVSRKLLGDFGKAAVQVSGAVKNEYASGTAKSTDPGMQLRAVSSCRRMSRRCVHQKLRRFINCEEIPLGTGTQIPGGMIWGESQSGRGSEGNITVCGEVSIKKN